MATAMTTGVSRVVPWRGARAVTGYALDIGLTLFVAVTLPFLDQDPAVEMGPMAVAYGLVVVGGVGLLLRRRSPGAALLLASVATGVYLALGYPYGPGFLFLVLPVHTAARRLPAARAAALGVVSVLALCAHLGTNDAAVSDALGVAIASAWVAVPFTLGVAERMVFAAQERERAITERQLVDAERLRVAQEVHDVVGHGLAAIQMQADIALHVSEQRPDHARVALEAISLASGQALTELSETLRRTHPAERNSGSRTPTPGLALARQLCDRVVEAGVEVRLTVRGTSQPLPSGADVAAYRLLQESLTNVVKHSPHPSAEVTVTHRPDDVVLEVTNQDLSAEPPVPGLGIEGMRRRAAAVGGELTAGAGREPATFTVYARLPRRSPEVS